MSKSSSQNNKSLGAEEGGDLGSMETLKVQTLVVSDTAEINGSLFVATMELSSLGSYEQLGPVDFNTQELRNLNIISGDINGADIGEIIPSKGYFTYLNSGISGSGYNVYFYGSDSRILS